MKAMVYDVEVLRGPEEVEGGWDNPEGMGFGTAVVYSFDSDIYYFFGPDKKNKLIDFLMTGDPIVSFNGIKFDNRVIWGNQYNPVCFDYDILLKVIQSKFRVQTVKEAEEKFGDKIIHDGSIGLDGLAQGTLGLSKTGHGAKAPTLIREAKWSEVFAYNLNDVRLTKKLYEFIQKYGYVIDRNGSKILIAK